MSPVPVTAQHSLQFVLNAAGGSRGRLLDVGCGNGLLSYLLRESGFRVTALDKSNKARLAAAEHRINVVQTDFNDFHTKDRYDLILFGRSLHHFSDPFKALQKAKSLLLNSGLLLVEEFAYESTDQDTSGWLRDIIVAMRAAHNLGYQDALNQDPMVFWKELHGHAVVPFSQVFESIVSAFDIELLIRCEYLFRYVIADLTLASKTNHFLFEAVREIEKKAILDNRIRAIGRLVVAKPTT